MLGAALMHELQQVAAHVRLRFVPKLDWDAQPLRDGAIDLEIGIVHTQAPEVRTRPLFRDHYVGICRQGHPLLRSTRPTMKQYAAYRHIVTARTGERRGPEDEAVQASGYTRQIAMIVPAYPHAMRVVAQSDLLAVVPHSCLGNLLTATEHAKADLSVAIQAFPLPVKIAAFNVSAIWHPRLDSDPAHCWLREQVRRLCERAYP